MKHTILVALLLLATGCGNTPADQQTTTDDSGHTVSSYCDHGHRLYHSSNGSIAVVPSDGSCQK